MSFILDVAGMRAERGERRTHVFSVGVGSGPVEVPVIAINGARPGPNITLTGGIHGAEYVGIEAARRIGMSIDPADVSGSLIVVPIANTTAFFQRSIYTSGMDQHNVNRMFPGQQEGDPSEVLAAWLFRTVIAPSQYYIDLHGGDMIEALVPFVIYLPGTDADVEERARQMALATGLPRIVQDRVPGSTYVSAAEAGIPSILTEVGGEGVWSEDQVEMHMNGVMGVLRHLRLLDGPVSHAPEVRWYDEYHWVRSGARGLFYPEVRIGDTVRPGQQMGTIRDYFGQELERVIAPTAGEVTFVVTSLAANVGDPLTAVAT